MENKHRAKPTTRIVLFLMVVSISFILSACNGTNENSTAASLTVESNQQAGGIKQLPPLPPTDTPAPAAQTTQAASGNNTTPATNSGGSGDIQAGLRSFQSAGCTACHANNGQAAGVGPKLQGDANTANTSFTIDWVRNKAIAPMPKFPASQLPDADLNNIAAYLKSLR